MAYRNNAFCWHGIITTDVEKAKAFYGEALGYSIVTAKMGDGEATMVAAANIPRAHISAPEAPGIPSHWDNYLRVDNVDATTKAAVSNGGKLVVPPTDIPPGRFSVVTSPSGAMVSLFKEADDSATNAPAGPGSIHWTELHSTNLDADLKWLGETLGVTSQKMPMPNGDYFILNTEDGTLGGAMAQQQAGAPAFWLSWVQVDDVDETVKRVTRYGGKVLSPLMDVKEVGRMAVVADPTGGSFGVITPPRRG